MIADRSTLSVPVLSIDNSKPAIIPPNVVVVATGNEYAVPVLTDIVPSALISMPAPILTPPSVLVVAVVRR